MLQRSPKRHNCLIAIITLLLVAAFFGERSSGQERSQVKGSHKSWACLKRTNLLRDRHGRPIWLASSELMDRVVERQPIERPGPLGKNSLQGAVSIEVLINKAGKVICARGVEGHPIAIAAAIHSLRKWIFRPYTVNSKSKTVAGVLTVMYDFAN